MADTLPQPNPARLSAPAPFFSDNSFVRGDQTRENNSAIWENLQWLDFAGLTNKNPIIGADRIAVWDSVAQSYKYFTYTQLLALLDSRYALLASALKYAKLSDTKAANTAGGTFTSGAWQTRTINAEDSDSDSIVSISSNQFTLQAGTYRIQAHAPAGRVNTHQTRLQNITDATTTLTGTSEYSVAVTDSVQSRSFVSGQFTIASAKAFELQHRCSNTRATDGFGVANNFGLSEIYAIVEIWKVG
jgi:hypothetical protein